MKKRVLSLILTLSMLLGLLPAAALAAELPAGADSWKNFNITLAGADQCHYHHGDDLDAFTPDNTNAGRGAYGDTDNIAVQNGGRRIYARERAGFKTADILLQPFTIDVEVPAYTSYTVTFRVDYHIQRNSDGAAWYYLELLNGTSGEGLSYNTTDSSNKSNGCSVGRVSFSNRDGGSAAYTFTATFANETDATRTVSHPMAYYVGAGASGSALTSYHHQTESWMNFTAESCAEPQYVAKVGDRGYASLTGAADAFNAAGGGATLTLLTSASGDITLTTGGTVNLNDKTLNGSITVREGSGETVAIEGAGGLQNGKVQSTDRAAITHSGDGTLTLQRTLAWASASDYNQSVYGVKNESGALILSAGVNIRPSLCVSGGDVKLRGDTYINTSGQNVAQIYLGAPVTLESGIAWNESYSVSLFSKATADKPVPVTTNWANVASGDPDSHFTDFDGSGYHFFVNSDGGVEARPTRVAFDAAGGTVYPTSVAIRDDKKADGWPADPVKAGYTFKGWVDGNGQTVSRDSTFEGDTVATAQWVVAEAAPVEVTVTYDANYTGGTDPASQTRSTGDGYGALPTIERKGYIFEGWFSDPKGGTQVQDNDPICRIGDHTLYAHWKRQRVELELNYNNAGIDSTVASREVNAGVPVGTLPTPIRARYTFDGWFTAADTGVQVTENTTTPLDAARVIYYAHWTESGDPDTTVHKHQICGATGEAFCTHFAEHEVVEWKELSGSTLASGSYYLSADKSVDATLVIPKYSTVNLCLNGNELLGESKYGFYKVIEVLGTLNLCDCSTGKTGRVRNGYSSDTSRAAILVHNGGVLNQYGGTARASERPIMLKMSGSQSAGTWNFYGGSLARNSGSDPAGMEPWGGTVTLQGEGDTQNQQNWCIWVGGADFKPLGIQAKPNTTYIVHDQSGLSVKSIRYTFAKGLPQGAKASDYFQLSDKNKQDNTKKITVDVDPDTGDAIVRHFEITIAGGGALTADRWGYLTDDQLGEPWTQSGYNWEGFYTQAEGGEQVTKNTQFTGDTVIYPRWSSTAGTPCDHSGNRNNVTTVPSTCVTKGSETFTCSVCGVTVTKELPDLGGHSYGGTWSGDEANHWHACTVCQARAGETPHSWDEGVEDEAEGAVTYTCAVCSATRTEPITKYSVTYEVDEYTAGSPTQADTAAGKEFTLPTGVTRTGYTLAGWVLLDEEGRPGENVAASPFTMPARDVTFQVRWTRDGECELQPGDTIVLEDGATIENKPGQTVVITRPDTTDEGGNTVPGQKTEITLPGGGSGSVTVEQGEDGKDQVTVPAGSTVVTTPGEGGGSGATVTVGGGNPDGSGSESGKVDTSGGVDAPVGSTVTTTDGATVTITDGDGGHIGSDGNITFPPSGGDPDGGGTVTVEKDGKETTVDVGGEGEGLDAGTGEAPPYVPENNKVQVGDAVVTLPEDWVEDPANHIDVPDDPTKPVTLPAGSEVEVPDGKGGTTTVTLPGGGGTEGGAVDGEGNVTIPGGSTSTVTDGQGNTVTVTVPEGGGSGEVKPGGDITVPGGGSVTVDTGEGGTTTITIPEGGDSGTIKKDGDNLVAPQGSTVTETDKDGNKTETKVEEEGGQVVKPAVNPGEKVDLAENNPVKLPGGGSVTLSEDGKTVTITDGTGTTTTVTLPESGDKTVTVDNKTGETDVPAGSTVQTGGGAEITLPSGGSVKPGGEVSGNPIQVGGATVTVIEPSGGKVTADQDGDVTVPGGTTAAVDKGSDGATDYTAAIPEGGSGTVKENGGIDLPAGGAVTVPGGEGKDNTTITMPEDKGGTVNPGENGGITIPDGSKVQTGGGPEITVGAGGGTVQPGGSIDIPAGGAVTIGGEGGKDTVVTMPDGGKVNPDGTVTVPGGSTAKTGENGPEITIGSQGGEGGTVHPDGSVTVPGGGSVTIPDDKDGEITITVPGDSGEGTIKPNQGGSVTAPGDSTVTHTGGGETKTDTVPAGGGTVMPDGTIIAGGGTSLGPNESVTTGDGATIRNNGDGTVTIEKDGKTTTITLPEGGETTVIVDIDTGEVTVPGGSRVQTGNSPKVTVTGGGKVNGDGQVTVDEGGVIQAGDSPVTTIIPPDGGAVELKPYGGVGVPSGSTIRTENGTEVTLGTGQTATVYSDGEFEFSSSDGESIIRLEDGTILTIPESRRATVKPNGEVVVPMGTAVQRKEDSPKIFIGTWDSTVSPGGKITVPNGGSVYFNDPDLGGVYPEVTVTSGGAVTVNDDGTIIVPPNSEVKKSSTESVTVTKESKVNRDGTVESGGGTIPGGETTTLGPGETMATEGGVTVTNHDDGTVTIDDGKGSETTVKLPESGNVTVDNTTGEVTVPGGSTTTIPGEGGADIPVTLPNGGTVKPNVEVSGSPIEVGDTTVTVTKPAGQTVTTDQDGNVTIPGGTTATVDQNGDGTTDATVTVPAGGDSGTVKPGGDIDLPAGGSVTIPGEGGEDTTITMPEDKGGTVGKDDGGNTTVPSGSTVQTGGGTEITVGGQGGTVDDDGGVTVPGGSTVTVKDPDGNGGTTEVKIPEGDTPGTITPNPDGTVTVPGGSTITNKDPDGNTVGEPTTLPEGGTGTIIPGGGTTPGGETTTLGPGETMTTEGGVTVTNHDDGTVTIDDGEGNETTVKLPESGNVTVDNTTGEVTVPDGSATTIPGEGGADIPVTLPNGGTVKPNGEVSGSPIEVGDTTVTVTKPAGQTVTTDQDGNVTVPGGTTATVDQNGDGTTDATVTVPAGGDSGTVKPGGDIDLPAGGSVTIPGEGGEDTTITMPEDKGGTVGKDDGGNTTVPGGSTVQTGGGTEITVGPGNTGTVDGNGSVTVPGGSTVTVKDPDGNGGTTEVKVPEGDTPGTITPNPDGTVTVPGGSTITNKDPDGNTVGEPTTLPEGGTGTIIPGGGTAPGGETTTLGPGETMTTEGGVTVTNHDDGTVTIDDGKGNETTVKLPESGNVTVDNTTGEVTVPGGSTTTIPGEGGADIPVTLPNGGTVKPNGEVSGSPIEVGDTTVTVTKPAGQTVTTDQDGNVTVPGGTTATVDQGGETTTVTVPAGETGGTIKPGGDIDLPAGGTVQTGEGPKITLPDGGTVDNSGTVTGGKVQVGDTTVTAPENGTVTTDPSGDTTVPAGSTVNTGKNGPEITIGGQGGTVNPTGEVTVPKGGSVTVPSGNGDKVTTVTLPNGGTVSVNEEGNLVVPGGATVTKPDDSTVTVGGQGGTVNPSTGEVTEDTPTPKTYTVTFNSNGGSDVADQTVAKGGKVTKPTAPTREKHVFGGWFKETTCVNAWNFDRDTVTGDLTLYAKWTPTFDVSGSVTEGENETPVIGAIVKLMQGSYQIGDAVTTENGGTYSFSDVPPGSYNVVATTADGRKTMTILVTVIDRDLPGQTLTMPGDNVNSVLIVNSNSSVEESAADVSKTVVGGLKEEAQANKEENSTVTVTMTVESKQEEQAENHEQIKREAGKNKTLEYLEIKVEKTVVTAAEGGGDVEETKKESITRTQELLEIVIPFDFTGKDRKSVVVYRYHGTDVDTLTTGGGDGTERIDLGADYITIYAKHFSTYAIGYTKIETQPETSYNDSDDEPTYRPSIEKAKHGDVSIRPTNPEQGDRVTITVKPDKGYEVKKVSVTDRGGDDVKVKENGDGTYTFTQPEGKVTIAVTFQAAEPDQPIQPAGGWASCTGDETCPIHVFTDASATAWYHDGVHYCLENGLMNGFSDGTFKPGITLSRAQLAQILYNVEGRPATGGASPFTDVANDAWCADAVIWANQNGIVGGYGNGTFGPNNPITREQLAAMLWRYAASPASTGTLDSFADENKVSVWAMDALRWAVEQGIVSGKSGGLLDPAGQATRAEAATMLMRYLENTGKK